MAIAALAGAAWQDHRHRRVSNTYWAWSLAALVPTILWELVKAPSNLGLRVLAAAAFGATVFALWRGNVFGGADAKGLMVLGLALSPVGYYAPEAGRILPALDALPAALLIGEAWRLATGQRAIAFFVVLLPVQLVTLAWGGLVWRPVLWLVGLVT